MSPHLEFPILSAVGARPEPAVVYVAGGSHGALRSRGLLPPAPCLQPAEACAVCACEVCPPPPAEKPPAAWPQAWSPPRRGMGREERRGIGDRHSLRKQLRLETDGGGGGGTLPPAATGGETPPSAAAALSPPFLPARGLRAAPGGTGRRGRLALPAPRATAAGRGSPASRGGAAAAARQAASPWESERRAGSAGEARV